MNKKNAFFAAVQLPENMGSETLSNGINVMHAIGFSRVVFKSIQGIYGLNTGRGNRHTPNWQSNTNVLSAPFRER